MRIRTDDAATRVEFTFYDLPGEARWFQWVRFYIACLIGIPPHLLHPLATRITLHPRPLAHHHSHPHRRHHHHHRHHSHPHHHRPIRNPATPPSPTESTNSAPNSTHPEHPPPIDGPALTMPDWSSRPTAAPVHGPSMFGAPSDSHHPPAAQPQRAT
ncbi:hypothetical protein [Dermatophilus congolensis]|uniref:hypothetical protein n=1 Tax=Dermatophilus congolensis TaxID=1863 RepID=UPI0015F0FE3B|nr:hypothetical protein [Dermatophilus congolensis]